MTCDAVCTPPKMSKTSFDVSVRLTRHNLSAREADNFRDAASHAFEFLADSSREAASGKAGSKRKAATRNDDAMQCAAAQLVSGMNAATAASVPGGSARKASWHCFVGRNLNMAVRMRKYACGKINVLKTKSGVTSSAATTVPVLKSPLDVFLFRSAASTSQEELRQACRPDTSDLHNIDPDPDEQERIIVTATRNDMDNIKFGTFAALCRIALAKNMRRLTQAGSLSADDSAAGSGSDLDSVAVTGARMSNAAAAAAAMNSLDAVAKYIRARMTEMHSGPWQIIVTAPGPDGRACHSAHFQEGAEDVVSIYSNAAQGVCIIAFRHTDDASDPFFLNLFGEDGLFTNPRTSRAASSVVMFLFLGIYLLIGWTSWLDCLNGGPDKAADYDGSGGGALAGCSDEEIVFSHRMDKVRVGFMVAALLFFMFSAIIKTVQRVNDRKRKKERAKKNKAR